MTGWRLANGNRGESIDSGILVTFGCCCGGAGWLMSETKGEINNILCR